MSAQLEFRQVSRRFGGLVAVDSLSFTVTSGEMIGVLGPNGSGKTTVLNMVSGALRPSAGKILFGGETISHLPAHRIARKGVARTFQLVRVLPSLSLLENVVASVAFNRAPQWGAEAEETALQCLTHAGLEGREADEAADLNYIDQKRLELARALAARPKLLLLDEWLSGLNPTELRAGIDLIMALRDSGMTILLVEHIMEAVRALCGRSLVMNTGGLIADGPTADVLQDQAVITAYLGDDNA